MYILRDRSFLGHGAHRALNEAADEDLGQGEERGYGGAGGHVAGSNFGSVEGAMVGINSVHVALSSVSAIQVRMDFKKKLRHYRRETTVRSYSTKYYVNINIMMSGIIALCEPGFCGVFF